MTPGSYFDGWMDSLASLMAELDAGPETQCLNCAVDRVKFTGITASADLETPGRLESENRRDLVSTSAQLLVDTAMDPDLDRRSRLTSLTRVMADDNPSLLADVLVLVALLAAKRYTDPDVDQVCTVDHEHPAPLAPLTVHQDPDEWLPPPGVW